MSLGPDFSDGNVPQRSFGERLLGAIKLDATVYEEVEHTPDAMGQAAGVVVLAVVAQPLGMPGDGGLVSGLLSGFIGWLIGTAVIWLIGVQILKHTSDFQELLRTLGFASAPQVLYVLGILPLGPLVPLLLLAVGVLGLFAWVIAVRQALDVTTNRSILICLLAQIPGFFILLLAMAATPPV